MKMAKLILDNNEFVDEYYQECFETAKEEAEKELGVTFCFDYSFTSDDIEDLYNIYMDYKAEDLEKDVYEIKVEHPIVVWNDFEEGYLLTFILRHLPEDDEEHWYFDNESLKIIKK